MYIHFGEGNGTPLQYSCLETPMDGGAWWAAVRGVAEVQTRLSDFTLTFHFHALEKEMATHSSVLAWRIPGTAEPGGLLSRGSHRVGQNWSDLVVVVAVYIHVGTYISFSSFLCIYLILHIFSLCLSIWIFSTNLSSSSIILFNMSSNLLLNSSLNY